MYRCVFVSVSTFFFLFVLCYVRYVLPLMIKYIQIKTLSSHEPVMAVEESMQYTAAHTRMCFAGVSVRSAREWDVEISNVALRRDTQKLVSFLYMSMCLWNRKRSGNGRCDSYRCWRSFSCARVHIQRKGTIVLCITLLCALNAAWNQLILRVWVAYSWIHSKVYAYGVREYITKSEWAHFSFSFIFDLIRIVRQNCRSFC